MRGVGLAIAFLVLAAPAPAAAVDVNTVSGLRTAITNANGSAGDDVINLAAGDYQLSGTGDDTNATGDLDVFDNGRLTIVGAGKATTTIRAGTNDRSFDLIEQNADPDKPDLTLSGLTVTGGNVAADGGGIRGPNAARLVLQAASVSGNTANASLVEGGAISLGGGAFLDITDSVISGNTAGIANIGSGGAIAVANSGGGGTLNITRSVLTDNHASTQDVGRGGAARIGFDVIATITDSTITGNTAGVKDNSSGGGLHKDDGGQLIIRNSTIAGNTADTTEAGLGGGLYLDNNITFEFTNMTLNGNRAGGPTVTSASEGGGIFFAFGSHGSFSNTTVTDNSTAAGGFGGGVLANLSGGDPLSTVKNTIVAGNQATGNGPNCEAPLDSQGHNLEDRNDCGFAASGDMHDTNPLLGPLQDNGGLTQTRALLAGSPAIDKGEGCATTDQRGISRPQGPACDIGAFEFVPPVATAATPPAAVAIAGALASPATFAVNTKGVAEKPVRITRKRKVSRGTTFRFTLSRAARVIFAFQRHLKGRKVGKRCRKPTRKNRKRRRCTRFSKATGFAYNGVAGANSKKFSGKIGRRKLRPGRYRVTLTAIDSAGTRSAPKRLTVRVVALKRARKRR
jgi:hypothetical protein